MPFDPRDVELAEKGLQELEALLELPTSNKTSQTLAQPTKRCSGLLQQSLQKCAHQKLETSSSGTAYLNGLRGFAALLVYTLHHQVWGHSNIKGEFILENAFGWDKQYYFVCLPGVRVFFSGGHYAVAVFFIISGYVLSAKPLSLIHTRKTSQLAGNIGSALFRRWFRLYIPIICTTFVWMSSWHLLRIRSGNPISQPLERSYFDEIWKWYCDFKNFSFVFQGEPRNAYNDHAWSISMEFRGSLLVYISMLAFSHCHRNARLWCEACLIYYFLYIVDGWFCALFAMGMFLCDLDLLAIRDHLPSSFNFFRPLRSWVFYVLLAIGLYLGGVPSITGDLDHLKKSPGWYYLSFLKPQAFFDPRWFFRFWAATFTMIAIPRIPMLKAFFEGSLCQYLGRVSYGFYLVHGPILWTLGDRLYAASGRVREGHIGIVPGWINLFPMPRWGPFGLEVNFLVPQLILLPFTLWVAELATRVFDSPSVKLSQWLYDKVADPDQQSENLPRWAKE
jgi:peptidoglycan/LPS O-acetylase OafA/YrhL